MEYAFPDILPIRIYMDDEERNIVPIGLHAAGNHVAETWPWCDDHDPDGTGCPGEAISHKDQVGLMPPYENGDISSL